MYNGISHLSFDMWNTLITPNAEFATQRAKYLAHASGKTVGEARSIYTHIKRMADKMAEEHGTQFAVNQIYSILVRALGMNKDVESRAYEVQKTLEFLFIEHPPILHPELPSVLKTISDRKHITMNVLSNTNFMPGRILDQTVIVPLQREGFWFNGEFYSDQEGLAKPNRDFFGKVTHPGNMTRWGNRAQLWASDVMHIGDNPICDLEGALNAGMKAQLVKDPAHTVQFLKDYFNVA